MLSLTTYLLLIAAIISICGLAAAVTPRYKRLCPGCEEPVPTTAGHCRHCGYRMA